MSVQQSTYQSSIQTPNYQKSAPPVECSPETFVRVVGGFSSGGLIGRTLEVLDQHQDQLPVYKKYREETKVEVDPRVISNMLTHAKFGNLTGMSLVSMQPCAARLFKKVPANLKNRKVEAKEGYLDSLDKSHQDKFLYKLFVNNASEPSQHEDVQKTIEGNYEHFPFSGEYGTELYYAVDTSIFFETLGEAIELRMPQPTLLKIVLDVYGTGSLQHAAAIGDIKALDKLLIEMETNPKAVIKKFLPSFQKDEKKTEAIKTYVTAAIIHTMKIAAAFGQVRALETLIEKKGSSHLKEHGFDMLVHAASTGQIEIMKLLISHGVKIDNRPRVAETLLDYAVRCNQPEVIRFLKSQGVNVTDRSVFKKAILKGSTEMLSLLLSFKKPDPSTLNGLTLLALKSGEFDQMRVLLEEGVDKNAALDDLSLTPLHFFSRLNV